MKLGIWGFILPSQVCILCMFLVCCLRLCEQTNLSTCIFVIHCRRREARFCMECLLMLEECAMK